MELYKGPRLTALPPKTLKVEESSDEPRETVVVVHGTFAGPWTPELQPNWWMPEGSFCIQLDAALQRLGSNTRCWQHLNFDRFISPTQPGVVAALGYRPMSLVLAEPHTVFRWSGDNSERARRRAGFALLEYLHSLDKDPRIGKIHLVAHSHGGNVVLNALRSTDCYHSKLGKLVFLGTPFLQCEDTNRRPRVLSSLLFAMLLASAVIGLSIYRTQDQFLRFWEAGALTLVWLMGGSYLTEFAKRQRTRGSRNPQLKAHVLGFDADEAIHSLRAGVELRDTVKTLVTRIFGKTIFNKSPAPASRTEPICADTNQPFSFSMAFWEWLTDLRPNPELADLRNEEIAIDSSVSGNSFASALFSNPLQLSIIGRVQVWFLGIFRLVIPLAGQIDTSVYRVIVRFGLALLVGLPALALHIVSDSWDYIKQNISKFFQRIILTKALKVIADIALGDDVSDGATQCVLNEPYDIFCTRYVIPEHLQSTVAQQAQRTVAATAQTALSGLGTESLLKLAESLKQAFVIDEMAHCQYYQQAEMIEQIAKLIHSGKCDWPGAV
jgi:hypothetical protein